jgi:hypothetical protein
MTIRTLAPLGHGPAVHPSGNLPHVRLSRNLPDKSMRWPATAAYAKTGMIFRRRAEWRRPGHGMEVDLECATPSPAPLAGSF